MFTHLICTVAAIFLAELTAASGDTDVISGIHAALKQQLPIHQYTQSTESSLSKDIINLPIPLLLSKNTLLHAAASLGNEQYSLGAVKVLLGQGADPLVVNDKGQTPIYLAAVRGHLDVIRELVASLDTSSPKNTACAPSSAGWTPLHAASHRGHAEVLQYLLHEMRCDVSAVTSKHFTPVHLAVQGGWLEAVTLLMAFLPNEDARAVALAQKTACLHTPGAIARLREDADMMAVLRTWGSTDLEDDVDGSSSLLTSGHVDPA
jgi:ankyrin repeat protein